MAKPLERVLKWLLPVLIVIEIVLVWTGCLDRGAAIDPGYATLTGNGADTVEFGPVVVDIYDAVTDTWSTATLFDSEVRGLMQTVTVGRKVLFAGGPSGREGSAFFGASAAVDIYDAPINTWSMAELSQIRAGLAVVALGGKALIAGGCIGDCFHTVDIYNATTDTWSVAALSQARGAVMATTVGTKALFAGGCSGSYCATPHTEVDIYDGSTGQWTTATLSHPRGNGAAVTVGSKALFAGGQTNGPASSAVDIFEAATGTWSTATLSQARIAPTATSVGTKALIIGATDSGKSNQVDIYDALRIRPTSAPGALRRSLPRPAVSWPRPP